MMIKYLTFILALIVLLLVVELIREERLTFKYAFGWLGVAILAILLTIFDEVLFRVGRFFGFELTSNFIFFSLLSVFVFLALLLTVFLCQQNARSDILAQKLAMIELELKKLKKKFQDEKSGQK